MVMRQKLSYYRKVQNSTEEGKRKKVQHRGGLLVGEGGSIPVSKIRKSRARKEWKISDVEKE